MERRRSPGLLATIAVALLCSASGVRGGVDCIQNGNFELGSMVGWTNAKSCEVESQQTWYYTRYEAAAGGVSGVPSSSFTLPRALNGSWCGWGPVQCIDPVLPTAVMRQALT